VADGGESTLTYIQYKCSLYIVPSGLVFMYLLATELTPHYFFFFFYWRYNPLWVLAFSVILFHSSLSLHSFLHPLIPVICISSSITSIHLFLGLPLILLPIGFHSNIHLGVLFSSSASRLLFINLTPYLRSFKNPQRSTQLCLGLFCYRNRTLILNSIKNNIKTENLDEEILCRLVRQKTWSTGQSVS
jgi:hypothetical protein